MIEGIAKWIGSGAWQDAAWRVAAALVIVAVAILAERVLRWWMERLRRGMRDSDAGNVIYVIEKIGGYIIIVVGFLVALSRLGVDLQSFSLFAGALGVGAGLGLQGIVKEFFSGLVLIFNPAMRVGDFVELENGVRGEIAEIGTRSTRLRTNDEVHILIPNSTMTQSRVINWTYSDAPRRLHVPFSASEQADKAKVRDVVMKAARRLPFTLPDTEMHKTQVWLIGFAGAGLDFELIVWPDPESCRHPAAMHGAYTWAIHDALAAAGIANSTPQLQVEMHDGSARASEKALRAVRPADTRRPVVAPKPAATTNDAAKSVFDEAERAAQTREAEPARRPPPAPKGGAASSQPPKNAGTP
jgi:small-conductance mechanosensitive channel